MGKYSLDTAKQNIHTHKKLKVYFGAAAYHISSSENRYLATLSSFCCICYLDSVSGRQMQCTMTAHCVSFSYGVEHGFANEMTDVYFNELLSHQVCLFRHASAILLATSIKTEN